MTPMKPADTPRRKPAKMSGAASGSMIFTICWRELPRNERHMAMSDGLTLRIALYEFKTITGRARMITDMVLAASPMP